MEPIHIPLEGACNFRDLGGYPLACGGRLRGGLLYRSDHLGALTSSDRDALSELGIATVVDLRRADERTESPDKLDGTEIREIHLPVEIAGAQVTSIRKEVIAGRIDEAGARDCLLQANEAFVRHSSEVFSRFLHVLLEVEHLPLVFHCTAGKDRAGYAAALVLLVAGVPRDLIIQDYLATNRFNAGFRAQLMAEMQEGEGVNERRAAVNALMQVEAHYLGSALDLMDQRHGNTQQYLTDALDFDHVKQEQLRSLLLAS